MDIVVKGRHTAVPERFRNHVQAKLAKLERLNSNIIRVDVELSKERNPRLSDVCDRVELTVYSRGPVIRAEAAAADCYAALDLAAGKLAERLRRAADRRVRHHANHAGAKPTGITSVPLGSLMPLEGTKPAAALPTGAEEAGAAGRSGSGGSRPVVAAPADESTARIGAGEQSEQAPLIVREKTHEAEPMSLEEALSNMELVGHDFYLFLDVDLGLPSVVYRRVGYDYGVIRLSGSAAAGRSGPAGADQRDERPSPTRGAFVSSAAAV
ncbi:ribosomal subunit interface protein [Frankia sp. CcI156]|uniref:Ribosome hibernation promoting factor n=1 Tax=Frankia casuarinae (strain DSM 45818 / CECT 9043 / HFP020203 / CcI3) TaxID=106370 RepID=Q2JEZ4_FRACC|nr:MULTISPECIES: ribosome-associated translation inhibitor RaiA [Frankia]ABD10148.1 SSU ribosomal protein S30P [Frankia casuarinae]ETA04172.1 SSU ribosomal protein S30P/sigma 54 modulation protein [Frankia sp. CcI6]EYT93983.1 SSU ribosomal protein S30P/sigma 54 modulation protein [Frankia casuarinae]KDA44608.1 SSU ribosomal protein S30P/sigma 54 modulation protein [Frankia sp. BMG5.23]OAA27616.1 sigma 54 modulation protein [Frankia casuarinae]